MSERGWKLEISMDPDGKVSCSFPQNKVIALGLLKYAEKLLDRSEGRIAAPVPFVPPIKL